MASEEEEYNYEIKIPKERIAVLIGKKGEVKKTIEENRIKGIQVGRPFGSKDSSPRKIVGYKQRWEKYRTEEKVVV